MKLSVITINYNDARGLRQTVESVVSQSARKDFEYIVVDGGSTDGSKVVLEEFSDRIDKWVSEPDSGIYNAMNKGVAMASGEYLLFLNSGDTLHGNVIDDILQCLGDTDIAIGRVLCNGSDLSETGVDLTLKHFIITNIPHQATFIRNNLLKDHPYDESLKIVSDWKFFVETIVINGVSYKWIDTVISDYDCNGISSRNRHLLNEEKEKVLEELFPKRILIDYRKHLFGQGYTETPYDKFYSKAKFFRSGKILYTINVLSIKFLSLFKRSARWARSFPNKA